MTAIKLTFAAAMLAIGFASSASAMSVSKLDSTGIGSTAQVDQVRLVCNRWGRCWRTGGGWRGGGWHRGWRGHRRW